MVGKILKLKNKMKKFIRIINNIILCLRFPFLYPRNRFTGYHYNNWDIIEFVRKYHGFLYEFFFFNVIRESEFNKKTTLRKSNNKSLGKFSEAMMNFRIVHTKEGVTISSAEQSRISKIIKKEDLLESGEIIWAGYLDDRETIVVSEDSVISKNFCRAVNIDRGETILKWIIRFLSWIQNGPLQILHCIPEHTELDLMEDGWRKAFGIDLCKDLKKQLKKENYLYKFRIIDIKEKNGVLEIYTSGNSKEIDKILSKYQSLSYDTCVICGSPRADYRDYYGCPYCKNHIPKRKK